MTTNSDVLPLLTTLGHAEDDSLQLCFPPEFSQELLALLDEQGIDHNTAAEFSAGSVEWIEVVKVLGDRAAGVGGGLAGLAAVISAFVHRDDKKIFRFERGGKEIETSAYSRKDLEKLLQAMPEKQAELDVHAEGARHLVGKQRLSTGP